MSHAQIKQVIKKAKRLCQKAPRSFSTNAEIIETAKLLFTLRKSSESEAARVERQFAGMLHKCIVLSSEKLQLMKVFSKHKFNRTEKEILLLFALSATGMHQPVEDLEDIQKAMNKSGKKVLSIAGSMTKNSRLCRSGMIEIYSNRGGTRFNASDEFISAILGKDCKGGWRVKKYDDLLDHTYKIVKAAAERADDIRQERKRRYFLSSLAENNENVNKLLDRFFNALEKHPRWPLSELINCSLSRQEILMVLMLIGKELGFLSPRDESFTGEGLARCASADVPSIRHCIEMLKSERPLRKNGFIKVCDDNNSNSGGIENEMLLRASEFELTPECLIKFKIKRQRRIANLAHQPIVRPEQLVLSDCVKSALEMCVVQARNSDVMFEDWGLGQTFSYGTSVTALFSGLSGTGKTASAEAIAYQLGRPIITANYAEIVSKWVGETQKNIVRVFREAEQSEAVLFWDEADAMFYDRDSALRNWEVRDVNVLLQELERFKGVCILSTNRKVTLDKALERRIAIKVEFERPEKELRRQIWGKLIPEDMPLAEDISIDQLSEVELSGGEIKNVVLNAARLSLGRGTTGPVTMLDFEKAIQMEREGSWTANKGGFGFGSKEQRRFLTKVS
ncbi:MAG: hypothetical protein DRP65_07480 [Planctomycetota bacterium]|nr:MAG: hypothetical protein DRP65_07480 [Planctomycetota bacterium]